MNGNIENNENGKKEVKRELTGKGVMLIAIGALLVVLIVAGTAAWFTRITAVSQLTMDAAAFDYQANFSNDPFVIRAKDYINIDSNGKDLAAPGTEGVIPIYVSALESDIEVDYQIIISTADMDPEFKKRVRFYYLKSNDKGEPYNAAGATISEADISKTNAPVELNFDAGNNAIKGTLAPKTGHYEYIYWRWVYQLDENDFYYTGTNPKYQDLWLINDSSKNIRFKECYGTDTEDQAAAKEAFDEFDSKLGRGEFDDFYPSAENPVYKKTVVKYDEKSEPVTIKAFQQAMVAKIDMIGVQALPTYDVTPGEDRKDTSHITGKLGSAYVPVGKMIALHNADIDMGQ